MISVSMPLSRATASIIWCSGLVCVAIECVNLKFHIEMRALDQRQRHAVRAPALFEQHDPLVEPTEASGKCRLPLHRFDGHDLRQPADETTVVRFAAQRPVQS